MADPWDKFRKQPGFAPADHVTTPSPASNPFQLESATGGFISSAFSSLPEFIGADPTPEAVRFRAEHPLAGFASQVLPLLAPYAGAYRLSQLPKLSGALESTVARVANPVTQPIRAGAVRELVRFAPLEASRLVAGGLAYPDNFGELFSDVAFSLAFEGGFGAIGGIFRAGGKAAADPKLDVRGVDLYAAPTIQLRALREGAELVDPRMGREAAERELTQQVLAETQQLGRTGKKPIPYLHGLEGARGPQDVAELNMLFKPSQAEVSESGLRRQRLSEGGNQSFGTLNAGDQEKLVKELGLPDIGTLVENTFNPRLVTALGDRGAGTMARALKNPALKRVAPGVWMGRESEDGLHVIVKRLSDPAGDGLKRHGPAKVADGSRFLVTKTDRPSFFVPGKAVAKEHNYAVWSKWRQSYRDPLFDADVFSQADNQLLKNVTAQDLLDIQRQSKSTALSNITSRLAKRITGKADAVSSETARGMAEGIYDIFAPTMFKQGRNTMFGRHLGIMQNRVRVVQRELNKMMFGQAAKPRSGLSHVHQKRFEAAYPGGATAELLNSVPDKDWAAFVRGAISQKPGQSLDQLFEAGELSAETMDIIRRLQANDQAFLNGLVLPGLEAAGEASKFVAKEGYVMPVIRLGDFMQVVKDEAGRPIHIVSGKTGLQANKQAEFLVEQAKAAGRNWSTSKAELRHMAEDADGAVEKLFMEIAQRVGTDEAADKLIRDISKKMSYLQHGGKGKDRVLSGDPGMFKERGGMSVAVDLPTKKEVIQQVGSHYDRLGRVAAMKSWEERWMPEVLRLQATHPNLARDLLRKRDQFLGIEGPVTNVLNKSLEPILGPVMGRRAATKIASKTNEVLYWLNLGFVNPTFALLNSLTPLMTAVPQAAFIINGSRASVNRLMHHVPMFDGNNMPIGSASMLDPLKLLWQGVRDMRNPPEELTKLWRELVDDGSLHAQLYEEYFGARAHGAGALRQAYKEGGWLQFIHEGSTYMSRKSEEFSRVLSANMGYRLGRDVIGLTDEAAIRDFTRRFVETTNYLYGVTDRARIMTGPIGSVFGLFKNWQFHYLGMLTNYAGLAWREGVYSPLLWQTASALAIGGLGATPLRHMADGLAAWYGNDPEGYRWMLQNWPEAADNIWYGLPSFLGVSLQASSAVPGTDVRNEIASLGNIVAWERAKQLGAAVGGAMAHYKATGENGLQDPNVRDELIAAAMPRAISRAVSAVEGDYVRSMRTGYPQVRGLGPATQLMHGLGINTVEIDKHQFAARELWKDQERRRAMITGLGNAYAQAALKGDQEEMQVLLQRAVALQIDLESMQRSAQNFMRREKVSTSMSRYVKVGQAEWMRAFDEVK